MEIVLNSKKKEIAINSSLSALIFNEIGEKTNGIAVAVNQTVIQKKNWEQYILKQNDEVLLIKATQGG